MTERRGGWMQTYTGGQFWPLDPRAEEVGIEDIAHALSNVGRFGGHTTSFFSVAQHCVMVSDILLLREDDHRLALMGLLHDAAEAYLGDLIRPLKDTNYGLGYRAAEAGVSMAIAMAFGLPLGFDHHPKVKHADNVALATEARDLMGPHPAPWVELPAPLETRMVAWTPPVAEKAYLQTFAYLRRRGG